MADEPRAYIKVTPSIKVALHEMVAQYHECAVSTLTLFQKMGGKVFKLTLEEVQ